jgi:hypothetical protein
MRAWYGDDSESTIGAEEAGGALQRLKRELERAQDGPNRRSNCLSSPYTSLCLVNRSAAKVQNLDTMALQAAPRPERAGRLSG